MARKKRLILNAQCIAVPTKKKWPLSPNLTAKQYSALTEARHGNPIFYGPGQHHKRTVLSLVNKGLLEHDVKGGFVITDAGDNAQFLSRVYPWKGY